MDNGIAKTEWRQNGADFTRLVIHLSEANFINNFRTDYLQGDFLFSSGASMHSTDVHDKKRRIFSNIQFQPIGGIAYTQYNVFRQLHNTTNGSGVRSRHVV